ncbi:MAG: hypothetical protein ACREOZ_03875 [Gloeomargaritales cyanobacterium]
MSNTELPFKSIHHIRTHFTTHPTADVFRLTTEELASIGVLRCMECRHELKI